MPSDRPQFNVRLSKDGAARFERLKAKAAALIGTEQTQAQVVEMALAALEEKLAACEQAKKERKK